MVITLTAADISGDNRYFLSQGRTTASAVRNMHEYLCGKYNSFTCDSCDKDLSEFLYGKFQRWQNGNDTWKDSESWSCMFPDFTFPRSNRAEIVEISHEMYDRMRQSGH